MSTLTHGSLFAGIGGFMLAARWAGIENVWHSEIENYACRLLNQHFQKSKNYGNIKTIDWSAVEPIDILTGGFPCQPFSIAGKRAGQSDDRYLWPQMFEGIQELRPRWVVGENVPGIKNLALDTVLSDLERAGYTCQTLDIPACALNAPHARHRLWIVAHAHSKRGNNGGDSGGKRRIQINGHRQLSKAQPNRQRFQRQFRAARETGPFANTNHSRREKRRANRRVQKPEGFQRSASRLRLQRTTANTNGTRREKQQLTAFTTREEFSTWMEKQTGYDWQDFPRVCGIDDGVPNRIHRIKGLGNAVVPQIPYILFQYIQHVEALLNADPTSSR